KLLAHELRAALHSLTRYQFISIGLGGSVLLAYGLADAVYALGNAAETVRAARWLWAGALPVTMPLFGAFAGLAIGRLARDRAFAPFLKALPLSIGKRHAMAMVAALVLGAPFAALLAGAVLSACMLVGKQHPFAWAGGSLALFTVGFGVAAAWRIRHG